MRRRTACSLVVFLLLAAVPRSEAQQRPRYVVVLNSFEQQFSPFNKFNETFRAELTHQSRDPLQFIDVSLPASAAPASDVDATIEYLNAALASRRPDLLVSVGSVAAMFAQKYRHRIFPETPLLYSAVDQRFVSNSSLAANEAAVSVTVNPSHLVDNILRLLPDTTTLAVIAGPSSIDSVWHTALIRAFEPFKQRLTVTWFDNLSFDDILQRSASLPPHTAILFAYLGMDARSIPLIGERALPQLHAVANAPIFGLHDGQLGAGIVGGPVIEVAALGRRAADVAVRILRGVTPGSLTAPPQPLSTPRFDANELARWNINESRLPAGSVVLFRQPTAWQRYRTQIIAAAGVGLVQTALLGGLVRLHVKRKRADRLRHESETRFQLLADTAPVMIWMSDEDARCTDVNRAWLEFRGRTREQEIGTGWEEGVHAEDRDAFINAYLDGFKRREPFRIECRVRRFDGEYRWVLSTGAPRFTVDGSFVGYTGSIMDVTDLKLAKAALSTLSQTLMRAQEEERARIARELHDDVGQRIAALSIDLGGLQQRLPADAADADGAFTEVLREFAALGADVQALSHRLHSSKVELLGLAEAAASFCRELSAQQRVTIRYRQNGVVPQPPPDAAVGVFRVMQEAVINAVKHSGVNEFEVTLSGPGSSVDLTVIDHGIGFNTEDALAKPGLGLVSMRERVGLLGGHLIVQSRPGAGTTVRATIPVASAP